MGEKNILVVDDSATMRQLISMTVRKLVVGVAVTEAVNGRDALMKVAGGSFDLVLTDVQMPEMSGLELIENIRRDVSRELPIIVITTKGEDQDRKSGIALGANGYLTKPLSPRALRETVDRFLK